jgi:dienelactone hydrolase
MNKHLAMWQQLAASGAGPLAGRFVDAGTGAPSGVDFTRRVDLTNVGTMGHSRGGRGAMNHAADEHRNKWPAGVQVKAVVPLEPVINGGDDLVTQIPFATVIGACDLVSNPCSRGYYDNAKGENTARIHQFFVHGANHSFFNTQWSPSSGQVTAGDDANSNVEEPFPAPGHCRTTGAPIVDEKQLTEDEQRRVGVGYLSAFFRRYLAGETAFDALLTGREHPLGAVEVEFADPAR